MILKAEEMVSKNIIERIAKAVKEIPAAVSLS